MSYRKERLLAAMLGTAPVTGSIVVVRRQHILQYLVIGRSSIDLAPRYDEWAAAG